MRILTIFALMFTTSVLAQGDMNLQGYNINKAEINQALNHLKQSGSFSAEQIEQAKKQLNQMDEKKYNELIQRGISGAQDPAMRKKVEQMMKNGSPN